MRSTRKYNGKKPHLRRASIFRKKTSEIKWRPGKNEGKCVLHKRRYFFKNYSRERPATHAHTAINSEGHQRRHNQHLKFTRPFNNFWDSKPVVRRSQLHKIRRSSHFEATKLRKGRSGTKKIPFSFSGMASNSVLLDLALSRPIFSLSAYLKSFIKLVLACHRKHIFPNFNREHGI